MPKWLPSSSLSLDIESLLPSSFALPMSWSSCYCSSSENQQRGVEGLRLVAVEVEALVAEAMEVHPTPERAPQLVEEAKGVEEVHQDQAVEEER